MVLDSGLLQAKATMGRKKVSADPAKPSQVENQCATACNRLYELHRIFFFVYGPLANSLTNKFHLYTGHFSKIARKQCVCLSPGESTMTENAVSVWLHWDHERSEDGVKGQNLLLP